MLDRNELIWLFFRFSGRVNRAPFILTFLLMMVLVSFPLYQFLRVPAESPAAQTWSVLFGVAFLVFLWSHVAISVKRLHDMDRPGIFAATLFIPVVSILAFIALCVFPGTSGPNRYGEHPNRPR
ncbi:MAG: DUF805 domain-containing protein [Pseudaminobacter sp.]|nr:DUF805 domain-containing protein [Pseudaminobacter sp.]